MKVGEDGRSPRSRGATGQRRRAAAKRRTARLFVALYPPAEVASELLARLPLDELPAHRATPQHKVHLTALFIGEVDTRELDRVKESVESAARGVNAFELQPLHLSPLPTGKEDARLVAAITDAPNQLLELHERLAHRLSGQRKRDGRFLPHLTLCRFERPARVDLATTLTDLEPFRVESISLMQSRLGEAGATHRGLARVGLRRG